MKTGRGLTWAVAAGVLLAAGGAAPAEADYVAKGKLRCANGSSVIPLSKARVALWEDDATNHEITATYSKTDGSFRIPVDTDRLDADDDDEVYLSIELTTPDGLVEVFDQGDFWAGPANVDTKSIDNGSGTANFGTITWSYKSTFNYSSGVNEYSGTPMCAVFMGARRAANDYAQVMGGKLPFPYDIVVGGPNDGVPWTNTDQTTWPENHPTGYYDQYAPNVQRKGYTTSFHEIAHVVRHHFDGSYAHFLHDVVDHNYTQHHFDCKHTNRAYAFNEGWALNWESYKELGTCDKEDTPETMMEFEKNVANRLQFAEACTSRKTLVSILRKYDGVIHSFGEFASRLAEYDAKCASDANSVPFKPKAAAKARQDAPPPEPEPGDHGVTAEAADAAMVARISRLQQELEALEKSLAAARSGRPSGGSCRSLSACVKRTESVAAPDVLEAQVEQARAQIAYLEEGLETARAAGYERSLATLDLAARRDAEYASRSRSIATAGLKRALRRVRSDARRGGALRNAARLTMRRLADRQRASDGSAIPSAFVLRAPSGPDGVQ